MKLKFFLTSLTLFLMSCPLLSQHPAGIFENTVDVGPVRHAGQTIYDATTQTYQLSGSGANIWFDQDEFHYACKKLSGDFILRTRGRLLGEGVDPHRKFGWMVRTGLDTDAAMVSAVVHGDGLTAIQFRRENGANVEEVISPVRLADVIQLERRGQSFLLSVARSGDPFWTVEVPAFDFPQELFTGLFICSHNADIVEKAAFDNVRIVIPAAPDFRPYQDYIGSHLEVMDLETCRRRIIYSAPNSLQAPNWTPDNQSLIYNSDGLLYRLDLASGIPEVLNTDFVNQNNNDHVLSFDGKMLGISSASGEEEYGSLIFTVPVEGGVPKRITPIGPSYLHGWSPDGRWLTYTAGREGIYNIYKIPSDGHGPEIKLTDEPTLDDGSEYSPDGKYIYFNSARTGSMELWRMKPDGAGQEQLTADDFQNWFPHLSPDGKWIVFLSYQPEVPAQDHPFYKQVYLRRMPAEGGRPEVITYLYGGQGTINVPSWSPDGKFIAFVSNSKAPFPLWTYLLNRDDLSGWDTYLGPPFPPDSQDRTGIEPIGLNVDPNHVFTMVEEDGQPALRISGEHFGGISTIEEFENYHLQLQFKWGEQKWHPRKNAKRDSGILYHANGKHGADWGFWMQSQEFQVQEGDCGDYWGVSGAVMDIPARQQDTGGWVYDPAGELKTFAENTETGRRCIKSGDAENPSGDWNTLDLYCLGDTAVHLVNGQVMMILHHSRHPVNGQLQPLTRGKIQIQSEGAEVFYRNIRIRSIDEIPGEILSSGRD